MTTAPRVCIVDIDGARLEAGRTRFDIRHTADLTQDRGDVWLHNLDPNAEHTPRQRGVNVQITAGHTTVGIILDGTLQEERRPRRYRTNTGDDGSVARVTHLRCGDHLHSATRLGGVINRAWRGVTRTRSVVRDIAGEVGLPTGGLEAIPATATLVDLTVLGAGIDVLAAVCATADVVPFEEDGTIRVRRRGEPAQSDAPTLRLSERSDLLGPSTPTDEGLAVTVTLRPLARLGQRVVLGDGPAAGVWRTVEVRHCGDTWQHHFTTSLELRADR